MFNFIKLLKQNKDSYLNNFINQLVNDNLLYEQEIPFLRNIFGELKVSKVYKTSKSLKKKINNFISSNDKIQNIEKENANILIGNKKFYIILYNWNGLIDSISFSKSIMVNNDNNSRILKLIEFEIKKCLTSLNNKIIEICKKYSETIIINE